MGDNLFACISGKSRDCAETSAQRGLLGITGLLKQTEKKKNKTKGSAQHLRKAA